MSDTETAKIQEDTKHQAKQKFIENDAGDGTKREEMYMTGAKLYLCILGNVFCLILVGLDNTIVSTILNDVGSKFDALNKVAWLMSGFLLPSTVFAANWGQISIIFGRKISMLSAIAIFEVGSIVCAVAQNMNTLIGGRVLAGVGASGIQSLAFIICSEISPIHKRPFIFAMLGVIMSVSVVAGPLIGGALATNVSWRWCFYINLPIGGAAVTFFFFTFNPPRPKFELRQKFMLIDYLGTFLLAVGLTLFLVGLTFTSTHQFPWKSGATISCVVLGVVFMVLFCVWNFGYSKHPIIPAAIVKTWQVMVVSMGVSFMFAFFMSAVLYLSIYFQIIMDKNPIQAGVSILALIVPTIITSVLTGVLTGKTRYLKPFSVAGGIAGLVGTGLSTLLDVHSTVGQRIGYVMLIGVSSGLILQSGFTAGSLHAPKVDGGVIMASTFLWFVRSLGGTWATILSDIIYHASLHNKYKAAYAALPEGALKSSLKGFTTQSLSSDSSVLKKLDPAALAFVKRQIMDSIRNVFYFSLGLAAITFIFTVVAPNKRVPKKDQVVKDLKEREELDQELGKDTESKGNHTSNDIESGSDAQSANKDKMV